MAIPQIGVAIFCYLAFVLLIMEYHSIDKSYAI